MSWRFSDEVALGAVVPSINITICMLILKSDMSGRLSRSDHGPWWYRNIPAVITIKLHLHNDPRNFFLASILILSPTYTEHKKYISEDPHT
jgi:hypothetical protein